jgi:ATP-dependent RNA helicase RhlE
MQAIPAVLRGGDLLAGAQTGTGKTAGFTLPMLHRLAEARRCATPAAASPIRALILTPTRELAAQVEESVRTYGKYLPLTSMVMFGGVGMQPQIDKPAPRRGHPGGHARPPARPPPAGHAGPEPRRDLRARRSRPHARHGLHPRHQEGAGHRAAQKQSLLFSATFSDEIKALADRLLNKPALIEVARRNATADTIAQKVTRWAASDEEGPAGAPDQARATGTRCWCSRA